MEQSVTKNTAFMASASVIQKIISFVFFSLVARLLGVEDTGKYFFAFSFASLFVVLVDLGLSNVLVREGARDRKKLQEYLSAIIGIKVFLGVLAYLIMLAALHLLHYERELRVLAYVSGITMLFDSFQSTCTSALRAVGNLRYEAIALVLTQSLSAILGLICILLGTPLYVLIACFTVASAGSSCFMVLVLKLKYRLYVTPSFHSPYARPFIRMAIPFALAAIFARVYGTIDSIFLSKMMGTTAVGLYSIPVKIALAFQFIPMALTAGVYPRMSESFAVDKEKLANIFLDSIKYLALIALPIAVGISVLATPIITYVYTNAYAESIVPMRMLLVAMCFSFVSYPLGSLLNASNRQSTQTIVVGAAMLVNCGLNFLFIPIFGVKGAALASLFSNAVLVFVGYAYCARVLELPHTRVATRMISIIFSAGIMGFVVSRALYIMPWPATVPVGAVVYAAFLFATKTVTREEIQNIRARLFVGSKKSKTVLA